VKYVITMKNDAEYLDEQPENFINQIAERMCETEFSPVHLGSDGSFAIRCSEIAAVDALVERVGAKCH